MAKILLVSFLFIGIVQSASRWKEVAVPQPSRAYTYIDFADSLDGMLFSPSGVFARTADGGKTWSVDSLPTSGTISSFKYFGKGHCWVQSDSNDFYTLYHSTDLKLWERQRLPDSLRYFMPSVGYATEQKLFLNTGRAILASEDAGTTWTAKYSAIGLRHSIDFADSTTGIATFLNIGASGETYRCLSLKTANGGKTWDTLTAGDTGYVKVHFYSPKRGFLIWSYTSMEAMWFRTGFDFTNDGGKTFRRVATAATGDANRLYPVSGIEFDASHSVMIGEQSQMKKDTDGSFFVTRDDSSAIDITSFESVSENYNWILASGSRLFQSVGIPTALNSRNDTPIPAEVRLDQNYPNPFNPSTTISFTLPKKLHVSLKIYDLLGQLVSTLVTEELPAGMHSYRWNASGVPSGMYFYRLEAGSRVETKRLVLLK